MAKPIVSTPNLVFSGGINEQGSQTEIQDNQWTDGSNVETLPNGFRRRYGYTRSNTVPYPGLALEVSGGTNSRTMTDNVAEVISQGFRVSTAKTLYGFEVRLKSLGTLATSTVASLSTETSNGDGLGPAVDTGAIFSGFSSSDIDSEYKWYRFSCTAGFALVANTTYFITVVNANATGGNELAIEEDTTGDPYTETGGSLWYAQVGGSFTEVSAADLNFRILTGAVYPTAIHDYSLSDATNEYHLVFAGMHLYKNNLDGTYTPLNNTPMVKEFTQSQDKFPSMVTAADRCLLVNGTDTPSKKFYLHSATEYWENEGIAAPTTTATMTSPTGASPLGNGTYYVDYYWWNDDIGIASQRYAKGIDADAITATTTGGNEVLSITGLPSAPERTNDRATHLRVEIKQDGVDTYYRYVDQVTVGTTTLTINATNYGAIAQQAEYDDDLPPQHTMKFIAENHQFVAGNTGHPYRLYFSKYVDGTPYYESFPSNYYRDFGKGDGDYITALTFLGPRLLIVGFKNSIWAIDARNPLGSDTQKIAQGIGIGNHQAVVAIGGMIFFVSDSDEHKGVFVWGAGMQEPQHLPGVDDTFFGMNTSRLDNCSVAHYAPDDNRHQIWISVSTTGQTANNRVMVYDYFLKSWTIYDIAANIMGLVEESSVSTLYFGEQGYESAADTGNTDAIAYGGLTSSGSAIASSITTKHFNFGAAGLKKIFRFIDYIAEADDGSSVLLTIISDFGDGTGNSVSMDYPSNGTTFVLGSSAYAEDGGTDTMGGAGGNVSKRKWLRAVGRHFAFKFSSESYFHIKTVSFGIQPTGRR